jgi:hypothetical protein
MAMEGWLPDFMLIALLNRGKVKTLADLAIAFWVCFLSADSRCGRARPSLPSFIFSPLLEDVRG